jgi:hypothetical protein
VKISHIGPDQQTFKKEYELVTGLGDLALGQETVVLHRLQYRNAFKGKDREWLETHLENPTGRLTMIILMPNDLMATSATGLSSIARSEPRRTPVQPVVLHQGSLVYWAIGGPQLGARYALEWKWSKPV